LVFCFCDFFSICPFPFFKIISKIRRNKMPCQKCESNRILVVNAKCSDLCAVSLNGAEKNGYVPDDLGIGGGDYIEFRLCLHCGQIQGKFPLPLAEIEEPLEDDGSAGSDLEPDDEFFVPGVGLSQIAATADAIFGQTIDPNDNQSLGLGSSPDFSSSDPGPSPDISSDSGSSDSGSSD
jgi:hypothetical protein